MLGEINLCHGDTKMFLHFVRIPFSEHVVVKNLILFWRYRRFDAGERGTCHVAAPFGIPEAVERHAIRIFKTVDDSRFAFIAPIGLMHRGVFFPFAKLIIDAPACHVHEP